MNKVISIFESRRLGAVDRLTRILCEERSKKGLSIAQVADAAGISAEDLKAWEVGSRATPVRGFVLTLHALGFDALLKATDMMLKIREEQIAEICCKGELSKPSNFDALGAVRRWAC